jgi:hypothetical protein
VIEKPATGESDWSRRHIVGVFGFQLAALAIAAWVFRHALNPDAVAYLRIASYYAEGKTNLAISGYWSPLISWLLVPFLKLGVPPLASARIVMGLSAVLFLWGCLRIFRQFQLPPRLLGLGLWVSALVSIPWSVENITPDLLLAALVCFAFAGMVTPDWFRKPSVTLLGGALWGMAYLCKSIALPLGILTSLGLACLWWRKEPGARFRIAAGLGLVWLGIGLVAIPWIGIISQHYGKFTVASSAGLNHSLVGPSVTRPLFLLDQGFHQPEAGRVTIWEDPTPPYPDWSPLASGSNALHQLRILARNVPIVVVMLTGVSLAFPILALAALLRLLPRGIVTGREPNGWWAMLPVLVLAALYLPNYLLVYEQRYFYVAFPLLMAASAGWLSADQPSLYSQLQRRGAWLIAACFLIPTFARSGLHLRSTRAAGECADFLAGTISRAGLAGSVAGSGRLPGGRAGLYTAYLLDQPWLGDAPFPDAAGFRHSGASLVLINRGSGVARELTTAAGFQDIDSRLFDSAEEAGRFPLQVFQLEPAR